MRLETAAVEAEMAAAVRAERRRCFSGQAAATPADVEVRTSESTDNGAPPAGTTTGSKKLVMNLDLEDILNNTRLKKMN